MNLSSIGQSVYQAAGYLGSESTKLCKGLGQTLYGAAVGVAQASARQPILTNIAVGAAMLGAATTAYLARTKAIATNHEETIARLITLVESSEKQEIAPAPVVTAGAAKLESNTPAQARVDAALENATSSSETSTRTTASTEEITRVKEAKAKVVARKGLKAKAVRAESKLLAAMRSEQGLAELSVKKANVALASAHLPPVKARWR